MSDHKCSSAISFDLDKNIFYSFGNNTVFVGLLARYGPAFALCDLSLVEAVRLIVGVRIVQGQPTVHTLQHLQFRVGFATPRTPTERVKTRMHCRRAFLLLLTAKMTKSSLLLLRRCQNVILI